MRKKATITFTIDAHYPYIDDEKLMKKLSKDFDQYLKDWCAPSDEIVPVLCQAKRSHFPNAKVVVKIKRDKEVILETWWDVLSPDF
jgi:hypothetical protein